MGPISQAPLPVEGVDVTVAFLKPFLEVGENIRIVHQCQTGLIIHLPSHHSRMIFVALNDFPYDAFGQTTEGCVVVVDVLSPAVWLFHTCRDLQGCLGVSHSHPRRRGICRCPDDDIDTTLMGTIKDRLKPFKIEDPVFWLPR